MESSTSIANDRITVHVDEDDLRAYIQFAGEAVQGSVTETEVIAALVEAEIAIDDDVRERVQKCVERHGKGGDGGAEDDPDDIAEGDESADSGKSKDGSRRFLVAKGQAANHGRDETIEWAEQFQTAKKSWESDGDVDFYSFNQIVTVAQDAVIGVVLPLISIREGLDVRGKKISANGDPQRLQLDETIQGTEDEPQQLIAKVPGRVVQDGNKITIEEVVRVEGDMGFETGHIKTPAHVYIAGAIPDRFEVRSERGVVVESVIEAANVWASDDVVVRGGVVGRQAGSVCAGGNVVAKFFSEANVAAGRDISVSKQIMGSRVFAGEKLMAPQCAIIGGQAYASKNAEVNTLGNDSDPATSIAVGCNLDVLKECVALEACMKLREETEAKIRKAVQSLLDDGAVNPEQRKRARKLVGEADQLAKQVSESRKQLEQCLEKIVEEEGAYVRVNSRIHRNVSITIGRRMTVFEKDLGGPVSIETRQIKNVTEVVAINRLTGSIQILKSYKHPNETLFENFKTDVLPRDNANH